MKTIRFILFLLCALPMFGASTNRITAIVTVTNGTANGFKFTLNASSRTFTNSVTAPLTEIATNATVAGTASNLWFHIVSSGFSGPVQPVGYTNGSNIIYLRGQIGQAMSVSFVSNWATVSYSTQVFSAGFIDVRVPIETEGLATQTNVASLLVQGIDLRTTNRFSTNSIALANFAPRTNANLYSPVEFGGSYSNGIFTNALRINSADVVATNVTALSGTYSNAVVTNALRINSAVAMLTNAQVDGGSMSNVAALNLRTASGTLGNLTNGVLQSVKLTNASGEIRGVLITNAAIDNSYASNLFGTFLNPTLITDGNDDMGSLITFTNRVPGTETQILFDNGRTNQHISLLFNLGGINWWGVNVSSNSFFINDSAGNNLISLYSGNLTLGNSSVVITNAGLVVNPVQTNSTLRGTNVLNGRIDFTSRANSALANGYNSAVVVGTNAYVQFSGPSAAYTNAGFAAPGGPQFVVCQFDNPGLSFTLLDSSGLEGTAANRILTGTGALLNSTNNPAMVTMIYDTGASRWRILSFR